MLVGQSNKSDGEKAGPSQTNNTSKPGLSMVAYASSSRPENGGDHMNVRRDSQEDKITVLDFSDLKEEH